MSVGFSFVRNNLSQVKCVRKFKSCVRKRRTQSGLVKKQSSSLDSISVAFNSFCQNTLEGLKSVKQRA